MFSKVDIFCLGASLMRNVKREKSLSTIVYEGSEGTGKMQTMTISADSNHTEETTEINNSNNVSRSIIIVLFSKL